MQFDAHIRRNGTDFSVHQSLDDHCRHTAAYAAAYLACIGLENSAYLAGLLHDAGKYKKEFQEYLTNENGIPGTVNHSFAGCRILLELFHGEKARSYQDTTAELLAYAVGAHHGLFDCMNKKGTLGFDHIIQKERIYYEESRTNFLLHCADLQELKELFSKACAELDPIYEKLINIAETEPDSGDEQLIFSLGQLTRLILSAVIEGDRRDTAEFMNEIPYRELHPKDPHFWDPYLKHMENQLDVFPQETKIQKARRKISDLCRSAAERPGGVYRLNVPTGGGKTLSALRYALAHAKNWHKDRIIFVTPLLTILEQNAAAIRNFLGNDSIILEHHSNVLNTEEKEESLDPRELAVESWDSPVIITTLVQLLNTMFLGKTTSVRRYHSLCNAVIVIDEVQTVPNKMLSLFNTAVNFLSEVCGTTFLLCSATQPCFEKAEHPLHFTCSPDVVPYEEELWKLFRRTEVQNTGTMKLDEIPEFAYSILRKCDSLLIICNKKRESEFLFNQMSRENLDIYHLSSAMCMAHRRNILHTINETLVKNRNTGKKTLCVATQVMEAGVDISFGSVIRLTAGMDSVVQAAGRCNRNGENPDAAPVYVVTCADENLKMLREIQEAKLASLALLNQFEQDPEKLDHDLISNASIDWYYEKLYRQQPIGYQQFKVKDHPALFELLSGNNQDPESPDFGKYTLNQAFKTAGKLFEVLDNNTEDVIVPYEKGASLIVELSSFPNPIFPEQLKKWVLAAKPYTISLYDYQKKKLDAGLSYINGVLVLQPEYYNSQTGLVLNPESSFLEV